LALQVGKSFIRLLELGEDGKPIFQPQEIIFEDGDENKKLSALKKVVAEYGLQGNKVIASLPANDGILKLYKYPSKISQKDFGQRNRMDNKKRINSDKRGSHLRLLYLARGRCPKCGFGACPCRICQ
jgi:type IV pilus assembly protein PilM